MAAPQGHIKLNKHNKLKKKNNYNLFSNTKFNTIFYSFFVRLSATIITLRSLVSNKILLSLFLTVV